MKEEDSSWIMGFRLIDDRENRTVTIQHTQYINTILKRYALDVLGCELGRRPQRPPLHLQVCCPNGPIHHLLEQQEANDGHDIVVRSRVHASSRVVLCPPRYSDAPLADGTPSAKVQKHYHDLTMHGKVCLDHLVTLFTRVPYLVRSPHYNQTLLLHDGGIPPEWSSIPCKA